MISTSPDVKGLGALVSMQSMLIARHSSAPGLTTRPNVAAIGVEAGSEIPAGSSVSLGSSDLVLGHNLLTDKRDSRKLTSSSFYVKVHWRNGQLETDGDGNTSVSWIQIMRCARDRHEQNIELARRDTVLYVCTVRTIRQGEELLIWYGEGLAREVGVPILTPCHIRGHQEYICSGCQAHFSHPNTLKAHMFLRCKSSVVLPDGGTLVPFQRVLQTLSRPLATSTSGSDKDQTPLRSESRTTTISSCGLRPGCSGCGDHDEESQHKSAFRTPSTSRDIKKETGSEELMTPDSSTDQSAALNLSIKLSETCRAAEHVREVPFHAIHPWSSLTAQQMMAAQSLSIPFDYTPFVGCYPGSPQLQTFGIRFMKTGQRSIPLGHSYVASLDRSLCGSGEYSLLSQQMETSQEHIGIYPFKAHTLGGPSALREARQSNSYGFALPSDKEPLDLLPQAYFANKSNKGHLCLCCGKLYSRKYGLKIHMRTHNGYKPLKCKICSRPFGDPSNLNKHVRLHAQGDTPYRCEFCGKVLVRRRDLERHVRSRHPMGCVRGDEAIGGCESSPDSSPISIESSENALAN